MLPIGGPGEALTALDQGKMLFELTGRNPFYFPVPVSLMDGIIGLLDLLAKAFPSLKVAGGVGAATRAAAATAPACIPRGALDMHAPRGARPLTHTHTRTPRPAGVCRVWAHRAVLCH